MRSSLHARELQFAVMVVSFCLVVTGCSIVTGSSTLHKSAKGSVHLEEVHDWSFEASHPAVIDQMTMLKVVKGVIADDAKKGSAITPASGGKPMRVFSDEDADFLAPLLAKGISRAKPEQLVGFTVSPSAGSGTEPTAGSLYVQQGSIYLTIAPSRSMKVSGFMPSSTARIEKAPSYAAAGADGAVSMVIDHQALAKAPMPASIPLTAAPKPVPASTAAVVPTVKTAPIQEAPARVQAPAVGNAVSKDIGSPELSNDELLSKKLDELRLARESNKMKDSEIATLKKEVEWMKQELRERSAEMKAFKAKKVPVHSAPKKKTAEAYPTR